MQENSNMCELFGVSSAENVAVNSYLKTFMSHSTEHPHGWGMAVFYGDAVSLEKEPQTAFKSSYLQSRLAHPFMVKNMIAHIRLATKGKMSYENCHPFVKRTISDRCFTLAHNGTLFDMAGLEEFRFKAEGSTDSELLLASIIYEMDQAGGDLPAKDRFALVDRIVLEHTEGNKVNLLLYDGEMMYVHTNMAGTLHYSERGKTVLFSTVPLDDGEWKPVPMMQLQAWKEGRLIYEGTKHNHEYVMPDQVPDFSAWIGL